MSINKRFLNYTTKIRKTAANKGFAKYGRQNIALTTLVILIDFCNLAVVNYKVTAKRTTGILMPVLRKAPNVACKPKDTSIDTTKE